MFLCKDLIFFYFNSLTNKPKMLIKNNFIEKLINLSKIKNK
jgi:hypothetical protein